LNTPVTIIGPGADLLTIHGGGSQVFRSTTTVGSHGGGGFATLRGLSVTGASGASGAIYNTGHLALDLVKVHSSTTFGILNGESGKRHPDLCQHGFDCPQHDRG
jgi:hypothetical protein